MKKTKTYFVLAIALFFSFIISSFANDTIFVANSPRIREHAARYVVARLRNMVTTDNFIAQGVHNYMYEKNEPAAASKYASLNDKLSSIPFNKVAPGVYAKTDNKIIITEFRTNEVEWLEYTYHVDGREIKIKVPKGQEPPTQDSVEKQGQ